MTDFSIGQGNRKPALQATLMIDTTTGRTHAVLAGTATPAGLTVIDLTGATVTFLMDAMLANGQPGVNKVNAAASIVGSPALGVVSYAWAAADTDTEGLYLAAFHVVDSGGLPMDVPNDPRLVVHVDPKLV